jgi:hypothetical protein
MIISSKVLIVIGFNYFFTKMHHDLHFTFLFCKISVILMVVKKRVIMYHIVRFTN